MSYKKLVPSRTDLYTWKLMTSRQMERRGRRGKGTYTQAQRIHDQRKHRLAGYNSRAGAERLTIYEYELVVEQYDSKCVCCGVEETDTNVLGLDHVVPISVGGLNQSHNLQPMCKACNTKKGTKTIDYRCSPPKEYRIDDKTMQVVVKELG